MVAPATPAAAASRVMIVDDEPINIRVARKHLERAGVGEVVETTRPREAMDLARRSRPDTILLDLMMPEVGGMELLAQIRGDADLSSVPVLILTASGDSATRAEALELGATDFLSKPVDAAELVPRVRNTLAAKRAADELRRHATRLEEDVRLRTEEISRTRIEVVHCLARAAEFRDNDTGRHILRVGRYSAIIAAKMDLDPRFIEMLELAAPLHDVGKIGIPDEILLKPGKLDAEEMDVIRKHTSMGGRVFDEVAEGERLTIRGHTDVGGRIIGEPEFELMRLAKTIALTHHEKYDGSGYPLGLGGEDIPLAGRIVAVADVFDALSSRRPYKEPFPRQKCFDILEKDRGTHFDPLVLDAFFASGAEIVRTQIELADV